MNPEPRSCTNTIEYGFAVRADLSEIQRLLTRCGLRTDGSEEVLEHWLVARSGPQLVGTIALEPYGQSGLLRSLAVAPEHRGQGIGRSLCAKIISHARLEQIERLFLLTVGADAFFAALGFAVIGREAVPAGVHSSAQFKHLCPVSAVCMSRDIGAEAITASSDLLRLRADVPGARMWAVSLQRTMLTYFEVEPHSRFEAHSHESEQITMVLTGELFFEVQGRVHCIKPQEVIAIPSSVPHAVWTEGSRVTAVDAWSPIMRKYGQPKD